MYRRHEGQRHVRGTHELSALLAKGFLRLDAGHPYGPLALLAGQKFWP